MSRGKAVEQIPCGRPAWHEEVHKFDEFRSVRGFKKVNHLVQDDVIKALPGLFGEFGVQANGAGGRVAAAPSCFHMLHVEFPHRDIEPWLPHADQRRSRTPEKMPIPACDDRLFCGVIRAGSDAQEKTARPNLNARGSLVFDHLEQISLAPDVVAFAVEIFAGRLTVLLCIFACCCLIQPSLEMAKTRMVSSVMRSGAEIRTLPVGG